MSYLKIPLTPAVNGQTSVVIQKKDILSVLAVNATSTIINMNSSVAAEDVLTLTHTAAAAGYNVADILQEGWVSNPGGIVSTIGGIPATVSATGQALTFVVFSAALFS
jgi:hypothetical protein|tara:strand:+ start:860 stop:1183 length:324 start_codon:yes stop_codon:yes gene_type:complete